MKKFVSFFALAAAMTLASCNNKTQSEENATDSTATEQSAIGSAMESMTEKAEGLMDEVKDKAVEAVDSAASAASDAVDAAADAAKEAVNK